MDALEIIKAGGALVEEEASLEALLDAVAAGPGTRILVHGGGRSASALARRLGLATRMVAGRRVTDADTLDLVTLVYGGRINKRIVAGLGRRGVRALGLCGADLRCIRATRRPPVDIDGETVDFGYVGDPAEVDVPALSALLAQGIVPVVAPLLWDGADGLLNTNADTVAAALAAAFARGTDPACPPVRVTLSYVFEQDGVLDGDKLIPRITPSSFAALKASGVVSGGMIPKLDNAFAALSAGAAKVRITSYRDLSGGTEVVPEERL